VLFTDFGLDGPYTGQMKAVLHQRAPGIPIIDLFADAPAGNPKPSAYLLAAYAVWFTSGTVFLCVVDPGVGGTRPAIRPMGGGTSVPATVSSSSQPCPL
jgi:S-adenosyl-L-methionine hydrolase (adenosine-forming)